MKTKTKKRIGIVAIVLVLLLAIGATAGTTLAKYISSTTNDVQTATVAKWGFVITGSTGNLFGTDYDEDGAIRTENGNGVISSSRSKNLVAPGANGSATLLTINGTAEVNAKLQISVSNFKTVALKITDSTSETAVTSYYSPIVWKVGNTEVKANMYDDKDNNAYITKNDVAMAIKEELKSTFGADNITVANGVVTVNIPAKTPVPAPIALTFSWSWAFGDAGENEFKITGNDVKDTVLGQMANETFKNDAKSKIQYEKVELDAEITISAVVAQTMDDFAD